MMATGYLTLITRIGTVSGLAWTNSRSGTVALSGIPRTAGGRVPRELSQVACAPDGTLRAPRRPRWVQTAAVRKDPLIGHHSAMITSEAPRVRSW